MNWKAAQIDEVKELLSARGMTLNCNNHNEEITKNKAIMDYDAEYVWNQKN